MGNNDKQAFISKYEGMINSGYLDEASQKIIEGRLSNLTSGGDLEEIDITIWDWSLEAETKIPDEVSPGFVLSMQEVFMELAGDKPLPNPFDKINFNKVNWVHLRGFMNKIPPFYNFLPHRVEVIEREAQTLEALTVAMENYSKSLEYKPVIDTTSKEGVDWGRPLRWLLGQTA